MRAYTLNASVRALVFCFLRPQEWARSLCSCKAWHVTSLPQSLWQSAFLSRYVAGDAEIPALKGLSEGLLHPRMSLSVRVQI